MVPFMSGSLFDQAGNRKYLTARERFAFVHAACRQGGEIATFCLALAFTGARISEVLALTAERIDRGNSAIVFETLKRRKRGLFRAIPVPRKLLVILDTVHGLGATRRDPRERLWRWGRTTAWKYVKRVMNAAGIPDALRKPKALRHGFAVDAGQNGIPLNIVQRWLGHARLETTAIYAGALGKEERNLARRAMGGLEVALRSSVSDCHEA